MTDKAQPSFIPYSLERVSESEMIEKSRAFVDSIGKRRSVRDFSTKPFPMEIIENAIRAAGTAPSGANKQPWTYCVVTNADLKRRIRVSAEEEEFRNYNGRMSESWLDDLEPLGTNHQKPFIEDAPALIIVFKKIYDHEDTTLAKKNNYYVNESIGISVGLLLTALHQSGLATLTHTPSPMNFLEKLLNRPANERAYLNIPVGYPKNDAEVPNIHRKSLDDIMVSYI
ncbi:MAG: nitroreductase family protein [Cryomorphaceae bacterium]|nr:nitroreductase family protein [Cryomorphaceae bacterium]